MYYQRGCDETKKLRAIIKSAVTTKMQPIRAHKTWLLAKVDWYKTKRRTNKKKVDMTHFELNPDGVGINHEPFHTTSSFHLCINYFRQ